MASTLRCPSCGRAGSEGAAFCRRCGARLVAAELVPGDAPVDSAPPSVDAKRILRELVWLCAVPVGISIANVIHARIAGYSVAFEQVAVAAYAAVALVGAWLSSGIVRPALRLPRLHDLGPTLLVALVAAPTLVAAFFLLRQLGFEDDNAYRFAYVLQGWPAWTAYVSIAVVTPISEELLFRGLIQPKLEALLGTTNALIVQAAIFSAVHINLVILVTHFGMGIALGWARLRTGKLLPGMLLHGSWNAWVVWSGF
jgi:membrane protease YdiL (CAAX protease family)